MQFVYLAVGTDFYVLFRYNLCFTVLFYVYVGEKNGMFFSLF